MVEVPGFEPKTPYAAKSQNEVGLIKDQFLRTGGKMQRRATM
jgi:hypothetical protein